MSHADELLKYFREQKTDTDRRVSEGIEKYRKGDACVLVACDGDLSGDITVKVTQRSHAFRFGANLFMLDEFESEEKNKEYRKKFPELFNLATLPFYWNTLEPIEGKPRFDKDSPRIYRRPATDLCLEYCIENGIEPKCHCLNYDSYSPQWIIGAPVEKIKEKLEKRFAEIASRYADSIPWIEVTNETLQRSHGTPFFDEDDFLEWSYRTADAYFPNNRLIINDYNVWDPSGENTRNYYYMQIDRLLRGGARIDTAGIQFHSFCTPEQEERIAAQRYNPARLYNLLDLLSKLGLSLQITEMTIPARTESDEDEALQAEIAENVYKIFFSHPAMNAIIYWNLVDGYAWNAEPGDMTKGENLCRGGLLRFDMSEKPVYKTLRRLIRDEWNTSVTSKAVGGKAVFRGFYGTYDVEVSCKNRTAKTVMTISEGGENAVTVKL